MLVAHMTEDRRALVGEPEPSTKCAGSGAFFPGFGKLYMGIQGQVVVEKHHDKER